MYGMMCLDDRSCIAFFNCTKRKRSRSHCNLRRQLQFLKYYISKQDLERTSSISSILRKRPSCWSLEPSFFCHRGQEQKPFKPVCLLKYLIQIRGINWKADSLLKQLTKDAQGFSRCCTDPSSEEFIHNNRQLLAPNVAFISANILVALQTI